MNKNYNIFNPTPNPTKKPTPTSKKEAEDLRKKEDEVAAAVAFEEYVATFQETPASSRGAGKVWVKAGTYDAGRREEDTKEKGKLYKPTSRFVLEGGADGSKPTFSIESGDPDRPERPGKRSKEKEKKKSNLEIFKEELKIIQEEREERHRLKKVLGLQEVIKLPPKPGDDLRASLSLEMDDVKCGSIDDGDPNTTNIYLGNLPTKISEQHLMEIFGKFGPLASVKVMWPRTDEEKARNRLSGFVAFMSRRDGERALLHLSGKEILNTEVKLGWGKAVPIPAFPIYIPPTMMELTMPPPPSGLPFNAQPCGRDRQRVPPPGTPYPTPEQTKAREEFDRVVFNSTVKVVVPTDRTLIALIHRMIEFVAREGPMFEAMIMNREISNVQYRFLFENQSPSHTYYRWKLYSILQGESTQRWRTEDFRMFKGGSVWRPPSLNPFTQGMPDELIPEEEREMARGTLSNAQRSRLEHMLRQLTTPNRLKIAEIMIFSIEHSEAIQEITECIKESLSNPKTTLQKKVARLFVISDILYNCTAKSITNAVGYRKGFKVHLPSIFQEIHYAYQTAIGGGGADCFKERVMGCCRAWDEWGLYPGEFLIRLQNIFLGLAVAGGREEEEKMLEEGEEEPDPDTDLLKRHHRRRHGKSPPRAQLPPKSALNLVRALQSTEIDEDIDGVPLEEEIKPIIEKKQQQQQQHGFIPSKWETVDPEEVKAGAVTTTSKWDLFEDSKEVEGVNGEEVEEEEDIDGEPMEEDEEIKQEIDTDTEKRRLMLREVELRVVAYQDELETGGRRRVRDGESVRELVEEYRRELMSGSGSGGDSNGGRSGRRDRRRRKEEQEDPSSNRKSSSRRTDELPDRERSNNKRLSRSPSSPSTPRSSSKKHHHHRHTATSTTRRESTPSPTEESGSPTRSRSPLSSSGGRRHNRRQERDSRRRRRSRSVDRHRSVDDFSDDDEEDDDRSLSRRSATHKHKHSRR